MAEQFKVTKQIFVATLDSPQKHKAAATFFDDTRLVITHCMPITGPVDVWREKLREEVKDKAQKGFAVAVEDRTGKFSPYANSFSFDEVEDGLTMLQHAFNWWFSLQNSGNLILDEHVERFAIRAGTEGSMVDVKHDDKGRTIYHPNWMEFNGGHKALLLCVVAAMMEDPLSERWLDAMVGGLHGEDTKKEDPLRSWRAITTGYDMALARQAEERRNNDN